MIQRHRSLLIVFSILTVVAIGWLAFASPQRAGSQERSAEESSGLAVLWTSGDPDVAHRMTLMYTHGAQRQGWFDEVRLIIWGPSQRLVVGDKDIRAKILEMKDAGVHVQACQACADLYGVADDLRAMDIEVKYMGQPLSEHLKSDDWHVMTF